jgi:hypothetical protein
MPVTKKNRKKRANRKIAPAPVESIFPQVN